MKRKFLSLNGGCNTSPVFYREVLNLEQIYSDKKQRFDSSLIFGCKRCKFGNIQAVICRPFSRKARPFPTSFWLVCPYLVRLAGEVESHGGVRELEKYIVMHNLIHEWRKYNIFHQVIRLKLSANKIMRRTKIFRDVMRGGIGGIKINEDVNVKCLHLQTASFLCLNYHPAHEWLRSKFLYGDCGKNLCGKNTV